ncbi:leucine-rich repeat and guanylate kinase domain-containing protein [Spea bombifrons]|uniref:leucine-rich repeat and guanylate kinase domain-containing protein n=1 Tax=Spea bombifrons TaxID=233779 RepID=UPI002349084E|nr:leucine-rich repeat and guanylate kinase domain-containing protein [Spea bombifrons]
MALAVFSPGFRETFSPLSSGEMETELTEHGRGIWEAPSPDNGGDSRDSLSDSESEQEEPAMAQAFDGVLREEAVSEGLSRLGRSAVGTEYVYLDLMLSKRHLTDIGILCGYVHLQKMDISCNGITDLSCVSYMPYLTELNASNNNLSTFFDFVPPKNLKVVDLSFNQISGMTDLSAHKMLTKLIINNNNIQEISGLEKCSSLSHLNLAHNRIQSIGGLGNLPIRTLLLSSNRIRNITGLENLKTLQTLDLSCNQISSLEGLEGLDFLQILNLEDNEICQISEIAYLEELPLLHVLNLLNNPIQEQAEYWLSVLFMLQRLTELDLKKIKIEEKVAAVNKYEPPPEVIAARDHMANVMYSMIQLQKVFDSTLPNLDTPYPMLVLTGPQSCGKRELAHRMCREFKEFFRYGPCHTTRNPYFGEEKRFDYHFVTPEVFEDMTCSGQFLLTMKYSGHYYGLSREAVESVAGEGLACCTHMEIEGVRSLKNCYFEPRYILLLPMNKEKYEGWLRRKGIFTRPEIDTAVSRVDMYVKIHQDCPGYFDDVINTDDLDEAYTKLRQLVKEYLGLTEPAQSSCSMPKSGADSGKSLTGSSPNGPSKLSPNQATCEFLDSATRNYSERVSTKVSSKTPAEEASVQRRQLAARQALAGRTPGTYTQLFQRGPLTAPATLGTHRRLLDPSSCTLMIQSGSNVTADCSLPLGSADTSSRDSRPSSGLSLLSSAGAFSARRSSSQPTPVINIQSPQEEKIEPLDLSDLGQQPDQQSAGNTPTTPRLSSSARSNQGASKSKSSSSPRLSNRRSRPGSNSKPVLPPIPSGQKKSST